MADTDKVFLGIERLVHDKHGLLAIITALLRVAT